MRNLETIPPSCHAAASFNKSKCPIGLKVVAWLLAAVITLCMAGPSCSPKKSHPEAMVDRQPLSFAEELAKAQQGDPTSQYEVACMYRDGLGVTQNGPEAIKWFTMVANSNVRGHEWALKALGEMYMLGEGVPENFAEAAKWTQKSAAFYSDEAKIMKDIVGQDKAGKTVDANQRRLPSMYRVKRAQLDTEYSAGLISERLGEYPEALENYKTAAEGGLANAQFKVGLMYEDGAGVEKNYTEAMNWYRKAAEQKHTKAFVQIGILYAQGHGVEQNEAEALKWFKKAHEQGDERVKKIIEDISASQTDSDTNFKNKLAMAQQGDATAQYQVGLMYEIGRGTQKDYVQAVKWLQAAADQGLASAQYSLGVMYGRGEGVQPNGNKALEWINKAAEQNFEPAKEVLKGIDTTSHPASR